MGTPSEEIRSHRKRFKEQVKERKRDGAYGKFEREVAKDFLRESKKNLKAHTRFEKTEKKAIRKGAKKWGKGK